MNVDEIRQRWENMNHVPVQTRDEVFYLIAVIERLEKNVEWGNKECIHCGHRIVQHALGKQDRAGCLWCKCQSYKEKISS